MTIARCSIGSALMHKRTIFTSLFGIVVVAVGPTAFAGDTATGLPLCADLNEMAMKDADLKAAELAAFGKSPQFLPQTGAIENSPLCEAFSGFVHLDHSDVLVTTHYKAGAAAIGATESLSAYVLRKAGTAYERNAVYRDFGASKPAPGGTVVIDAERIGNRDVLTVSGGMENQELTFSSLSLYDVNNRGIVSLGTVPTNWDNVQATDDDKQQIFIIGMIDKDQPSPDELRMTYRQTAWDRTEETHAVWRSVNGNYGLISGSIPKEMAANFDTAGASTTDKP
ncbi:hypothetical protein HGP17_28660 [Rhizobium sp. P38BS-XIX]|uniref:hypothetical protein n=1 Tax=Rhizobium sp. P38BS-XIX TaxID=2726740 RepID=UPI00145678A0|nr:hypothetical protein [Rhizobium sp. P38BS-XIX]NLS00820.1 hypothetical protein [Rhizobium sp. P38BS-XIX]